MNQPLVSIIIPTYNRKEYVQQAIDSVLAQTYPHYEIIVIDDGSTDGTGEALKARYGDRITYHWQENQGESVARNWGIVTSRGEYIGFLDDDDIYLPQMMASTIDFLEQHPDVGQVCVQCHMLTEQGDVVQTQVIDRMHGGYIDAEELLLKSVVLAGNSLIRRESLLQAGLFDPEIRYGEDGDLNRRVFSVARIYYLPEPLAALRTGVAKQSSYTLDPDKASRRYEDLNKTLGKVEHNPLFKAHMPRAWAQIKGRYALNLAANRNMEVAGPMIQEVFRLESTEWFYEEILRAYFLRYIEALDDDRGIDEALAFAQRVFDNVNGTPAFEPSWKRKLLGEFHLTRFFKRAYMGDWSGMRYSYWRAIVNDPTCLRNRGLHAYVVKSLVWPRSLSVRVA